MDTETDLVGLSWAVLRIFGVVDGKRPAYVRLSMAKHTCPRWHRIDPR